jgi:CIC family chloride channel protein
MTSVIMIFEITRDYTIIVPLMIANLIAFFISKRLQEQPIYEALAAQDGIHLPTRSTEEVREVGEIMQPVPTILLRDAPVADVLAWMEEQRFDVVPVIRGGVLRGVLWRAELEESPAGSKLEDLLGAREFLAEEAKVPHLHPDHNLSVALERLGAEGCCVLPVVSRAGGFRVIGLLTLDDALRAYGLEVSA